MKKPFGRYLSVACPTCAAAIGVNCFAKANSRTLIHNSRRNAAYAAGIRPMVPSMAQIGKKVLPASYTPACRLAHHEKCSGLHKSKHGMRAVCACPCHRARVTKDLLQSPASIE